MAKKAKRRRKTEEKRTRQEVPPGATRKALDRPLDPGGGPPGSGAGPRHAAGDPGSDIESIGHMETSQTAASASPEERDALEKGPPYAGISGGAVGGTPAQIRSSARRPGRGLSPGGIHRGDSTIGTDPESAAE